jgi:hypothetical protein
MVCGLQRYGKGGGWQEKATSTRGLRLAIQKSGDDAKIDTFYCALKSEIMGIVLILILEVLNQSGRF